MKTLQEKLTKKLKEAEKTPHNYGITGYVMGMDELRAVIKAVRFYNKKKRTK